jgi:hypothetical protein
MKSRDCKGCRMKKLTLSLMQELAEKKGGRCLSEQYIHSQQHLLWQCAEGHKWKAMPHSIQQGSWCPECVHHSQRLSIERMRQLATAKVGLCLSDEYINSSSNLQWQCSSGHRWSATPATVRDGGWCPECAGVKKKTIEEMRTLAKKRGGKCLSEGYESRKQSAQLTTIMTN